jgi:hypothetical protein
MKSNAKASTQSFQQTRRNPVFTCHQQILEGQFKQTSNSAVVKDERWGCDSIGNRTSEHDLSTGVTIDYCHNNTNQLVTKNTYSSGQKPWVKGNLDETGHVNLGSGPVAVKGDISFEGQAPARTATITAKDGSDNVISENWQLTSGSGTTRLPHSLL